MSGTIGSMPNQPKTTLRNVRVDDELWEAAKSAAELRGESVSEAIRKFLKRYVKTAPTNVAEFGSPEPKGSK